MKLQLAVVYNDNATMYYQVGPRHSWKIDNSSRCLVIGQGVPRTHVPLDQVRSFDIDVSSAAPTTADQPRCPSCDHYTKSHSDEGCWYAVTEAAVGLDLVCPCSLPNGVDHEPVTNGC